MTDLPRTSGTPAPPVSALILTLNEEANIARCIEALDWCNDVVVLDSASSDGTRSIAERLGARVYERVFDNFAGQRNYALDSIEFRNPWILHLDADEVVTPELRGEMGSHVAAGQYKAFRIPSKLIFRGRWLKHAGMYPCYQVRLGHIDALRFEQVGHGQRERLPSEEIGTLREPYLHYSLSKGIADWIERHNRYSSDEALHAVREQELAQPGLLRAITASDRTQRRRALKATAARLPFRPTLRFLYMYVLKLGFLDGAAGFDYCRMLAMYEYWTVLKIRELRQNQGQAA